MGNGSSSIRATFPNDAVDPQGTTFPTATFYIASDSINGEGLDERIVEFIVEVHIYVEAQPAAGGDSLLVQEKIKERVIGDWPEQSSKAPSYGLDRHILDFTGHTGDAVTAYSAMSCEYLNGRDATDFDGGGIREWIQTYRVGMVKQKP